MTCQSLQVSRSANSQRALLDFAAEPSSGALFVGGGPLLTSPFETALFLLRSATMVWNDVTNASLRYAKLKPSVMLAIAADRGPGKSIDLLSAILNLECIGEGQGEAWVWMILYLQ